MTASIIKATLDLENLEDRRTCGSVSSSTMSSAPAMSSAKADAESDRFRSAAYLSAVSVVYSSSSARRSPATSLMRWQRFSGFLYKHLWMIRRSSNEQAGPNSVTGAGSV